MHAKAAYGYNFRTPLILGTFRKGKCLLTLFSYRRGLPAAASSAADTAAGKSAAPADKRAAAE